jgi:SET domain-containing protein
MFQTCTSVDDSPIHGKGLFATCFIPANSLLGRLTGEYTTTDGDYVLWLDESTGFQVTCRLRYINHSAEPNAVYYDDLQVHTLRDIYPGDEITHDYGSGWDQA